MSKRFAWTAIAALAPALGSPGALAQSSEAARGANATAAGSARAGPSATASPRDRPAVPPKPVPERSQRASRIIGMDVVNRHGQKIGDVEDIVLDADGNVTHAVVSTGGFLGMGERLHAVPWRSLVRNTGREGFLLDIDSDSLRGAPGFDRSSFPDFNDPKWSSENRRHFPAGSAPGRAGTAAGARTTGGSTIDPPRAPGGTSAGRTGFGNDIGPSGATSGRSGTSTTASDPGSTPGMAPRASPNERRQPMPGSSGGTANLPAPSGGAANPGDPPPTGGGRDPASHTNR